MKQLTLLLFFITWFNLTQAQSFGIAKGDKSTDTPAEVENQFKKDYPTLNAMWSKEGDNYRADYTDPSTNMAGLVVYDKTGRILRTESELKANSYPGSIGDYHKTNLPRARTYKVFAAKDTSGIQSYYTTSEGDTYYFDKDGNYKSRVPAASPGKTQKK